MEIAQELIAFYKNNQDKINPSVIMFKLNCEDEYYYYKLCEMNTEEYQIFSDNEWKKIISTLTPSDELTIKTLGDDSAVCFISEFKPDDLLNKLKKFRNVDDVKCGLFGMTAKAGMIIKKFVGQKLVEKRRAKSYSQS